MSACVLGQPWKTAGEREDFFQRGHVTVMHFQFGRRFLGDFSVGIDATQSFDLIESLDAHCACVHPQAAADLAGDALHPLETADAMLRREAADLLQFNARARGDSHRLRMDLQPSQNRRRSGGLPTR